MESDIQIGKKYIIMRKFLLLASLFLIYSTVYSQLPDTQIFSMGLRANEEKVLLDDLTLLTDFNPGGYNNQPFFLTTEKLLITSDFKSLGLTDIWQLDLNSSEVQRVTATEESEYSPHLMPDNFSFSVVRQELDDTQPVPQTLWSYPLDQSGVGVEVIPNHRNIGYYLWMTEEKVALFLVGDQSQLLIHDLVRGTSTQIALGVGRCLKKDRYNILYYSVEEEEVHVLYRHDMYIGTSKRVTTLPPGTQDFDILSNGHLIAGDGMTLKTYDPLGPDDWKEVKNLNSLGKGRITRIASSSDRIAFVTSR